VTDYHEQTGEAWIREVVPGAQGDDGKQHVTRAALPATNGGTDMKLMLHIIRKDFRHLRNILGTWYALVILIGASSAHRIRLKNEPDLVFVDFLILLSQAAVVELLVRAAVVSKLIHSDSAVGSTAFWLSRPIPRTILLASKAAFLAMLVVLPAAIVESALGSPFAQSPPSLLEALLTSMAWASIFTMLAVLTRNLAGMAALAGICLGVLWTGSIGVRFLTRWHLEQGGTGTKLSDEWTMLFLVVACGAVTCHQYLTRRTVRSRVLVFSGIPIALLLFSVPWS